MKILIYKRNSLINSSGGAEKAMCALAGHFAQAGHDVAFLTRDMREGKPFYPLDERVKLEQHDRKYNKLRHLCGKILRKAGVIDVFPSCDRDLFIANNNRKIIDAFKPDVIVATSPADAVELLYKQADMPPVIVTFHSFPAYFFKNKSKTELYKRILKKISAAQVLQPSFVEELKSYYDGKTAVIGNCIEQNGTSPDYANRRIVCLARVEPDKQQYELTRAFCLIAKDFPDWTVDFYGDITHPDYKDKCVEWARTHGAETQIVFHGITADVPKALSEASVCAFPSKFEGFGMGLAEALAAGLPAVGFQSASSVNELLKNGQNGFLAEDVDDFAAKLKQLMQNEKLRQTMGQNAKKSMTAFAPSVVWNKWDTLVQETIGRNRTRILVHLHLYYFDMWPKLKKSLQNITAPYDLFVTVTKHDAEIEKDILAFNPETRLITVANNGFDIWPFIKVLNTVNLNDYSHIIKLHTKRDMPAGTIRNGFDVGGDKWRGYLQAFLKNKESFKTCLSAFETDETLGMTADYRLIVKNDRKNQIHVRKAQEILTGLGLKTDRQSYVMGTMFMARAEAFAKIKELKMTEDSFSKSERETTDLLPCAFEILFGYLINAQGWFIKDVLNSPLKQKTGKVSAVLKNFIWRKKVGASGKVICKFCKIPVFVSKNKGKK